MGIERVFRDINGIEWHVSHVGATSSNVAAGETIDGWLSFEGGHHLERRMTPVPKNWHMATIQRLEQMCRIATPIQREQTLIVSHHSRIPGERIAESPVDTMPEGAERVAAKPVDGHVSVLANAWPTRESTITFRG